MEIQLINGQFNRQDAMDIISQMITVKIKYHENKISATSGEEEVKMREAKIKTLQKEMFECRNNIFEKGETIKLNAIIQVEG